MVDKPTTLTFTVEPPSGPGLPSAEAANYFHIVYAAGEVQLMVGTLNIVEIHEHTEAVKANRASTDTALVLIPDIAHRYLLSLPAFLRLRENVETIYAALQKANVRSPNA